MALPDVGQLYVPATADELRQQYIDDVTSLSVQYGQPNPALQQGTFDWIRATADANLVLGCYYNAAISADKSSELYATGNDLDLIRQAKGLPQLSASPSTGALIVGVVGSSSVLFVDSLQFTVPGGLRGQVNGNQLVSNGQSLNVLMVDTGTASNVPPNTIVTWISPPVNATATATVDSSGLTGGTDPETDEQKRDRILQRNQNIPGGGNWAHVQQVSQAVSSGIQCAFVYPTLGGPSTLKVALCKAMVLAGTNLNYSRETSATLINLVVDALRQNIPDSVKIVVQSVADEDTDLAIQLALPTPSTLGSSGSGWLDSVQFPKLVDADFGVVSVSHVTSTTSITVTAQSTVAPVVGQSVMWWSRDAKKFVTSTVSSFSGSAGAWVLNLNQPLSTVDTNNVTRNVVIGDYISAGCAFGNDYAATLFDQFNTLGPGENTSDPTRLARAARKPVITKGSKSFPTDIGALQLSALTTDHEEITDAAYAYRSLSTPSIPDIDSSPNVLTLFRLALYPL
jgi:uncharacterized phage protein gp47/JayE